MIYPGSIISGINIRFTGFIKQSPIPKLYNTEQSVITTSPKPEYILNTFDDYKMFMKKHEVSGLRILLIILLCNNII